jgi:hypothetical protein
MRKELAFKWYRKLVGKKEDDPPPGHISNDLWRHAEDAADKGKEEVVWHELMMFLHWQKKFADEKRQFKGSSVCS